MLRGFQLPDNKLFMIFVVLIADAKQTIAQSWKPILATKRMRRADGVFGRVLREAMKEIADSQIRDLLQSSPVCEIRINHLLDVEAFCDLLTLEDRIRIRST